MTFESKYKIPIQENPFEIADCKMPVILSRGGWVGEGEMSLIASYGEHVEPVAWFIITRRPVGIITVYPKKYAHGFCFAVLCCGNTVTDFPISIRLTSLALWQSIDCSSANKATLMNMDKYFMWIHYERLHNHNKAKHNKTVCIFLGIYCILAMRLW